MADTEKPTKQKQIKKTYNRPQLQVYGDLGTISQTVATGGRQVDSNPNHFSTH
jgi:hypothetical protein